MGFKLLYFVSVIAAVSAQSYRVCISSSNPILCQTLDRDGSQAICEPVESRVDCAIKIARGDAHLGVFSEEEMVLLSQAQPEGSRVVASIRDVSRNEPYAFEAVAIVPVTHSGGLEGLRGGSYCHPGLDEPDLRWSPRVLKGLERAAARTDRCPNTDTNRKTAEELEVDTLSQFFGSACRPGPWSANVSVDADLKSRYQSLCSLCGDRSGCASYSIDMGVAIAGVRNDNRHIQALECLRRSNGTSVAYVAWQHVREFFSIRNPDIAASYAALCPDGTLSALSATALAAPAAPCAFVRQPWSALVANTEKALEIQSNLRNWWPGGASPGGNGWQSVLFSAIVGGANARVNFEDGLPTPANYSNNLRNLPSIDASPSCVPARRWCTVSPQEHTKCNWLQLAAYTLGIEPALSCQQRTNVFQCLADIRDNTADFIATPANYGYLARQHYSLSSVKLVQNSRSDPFAFSRVAALVKETSAQSNNITRFENLRGKNACFPEFGGISFVSFLRTAHERGVISSSECDYGRAVGEFFSSSCAPGAMDASHAMDKSNFDATPLCSLCKPSITIVGNFSQNQECSFDNSNKYYGNNGSVACLADPESDVAFVDLANINANLNAANLAEYQVRVLCRNNSLAAYTGVNVDQNCLLAYVVDSEVLARRNDPLLNSLNALLDTLDAHFGYNAATSAQLINMEMYSPFDGVNDLLFKNTAVGLAEPSSDTANEAARNYNDLFKHLESCTSAASSRSLFAYVTLVVMAVVTRFIIY
ncbi:unnamed protein product [Colias eurytheme]|nr:unnamed protein product [Colias eurytheme]